MSLATAIALIAALDLGVVLAVTAVMLVPFGLDRRRDEVALFEFATPLPLDLAA